MRNSLFLAGLVLFSASVLPLEAQVHTISTATNLFAPSFRTGDDSGNTTWFGWTYGGFVPSSVVSGKEVLDQSAGGLNSVGNANSYHGVTPGIAQAAATIGTADIISGSGGLYFTSSSVPGYTTVPVVLSFPVNVPLGDIGTGFTTIIIQGHSTNAPYGVPAATFSFNSINGVAPSQFLIGVNGGLGGPPAGTIGRGQFWVKYEIPNSAASYDVTFNLSSSFSISGLQVDTLWSATGYAPDYAVIPEPSSALLLAGGGVVLIAFRRRAKRC